MSDPPRQAESGAAHRASVDRLRRLYFEGVVDRRVLERALAELGVTYRWRWWAERVLLVIGAALVLSGAIFFVAYNWLELDKLIKLGGIAFLVAIALVAAWWRGLDTVAGRVSLFACCVLVGVFLAAFGQVYQTGADAWELFRAWALLISVWVFISRDHAHWLLWIAVTTAAVVLHIEQVHGHRWMIEATWPWLAIAALQAIAIFAFEVAGRRDYFVPSGVWPRWVLTPVLLFALCAPAARIVFQDRYDRIESWFVIGALVAVVGGGFHFARNVGRDLFLLTCVGFAVVFLTTVVLLRIMNVFEADSCGAAVLVGLALVAMLAALVGWLRRTAVAMREESTR